MDGFVEDPGGPVHKKHECPPDRVAMMARLTEIQKSFDERLANQRAVVESLSDARQALLAANADYESFSRYVATLEGPQYAALALKAQELLNRREVQG